MKAATSTSLARMVEKTPTNRDRYVDFLRAFSIFVVVFGHWLMAVIFMRDGQFEGQNAIEVVPGLWLATWLLQVMPLFFFVGGFSHLVTIKAQERKGWSYARFLGDRTKRLMAPTVWFVGIWLAVAGVMEIVSPATSDLLSPATGMLAKPLWFLAVYVMVVALAPAMLALHRRFRWTVPATLISSAVVVDLLRFGVSEHIGYLNFAFVWLLSHQLGFFYADGTFERWTRWMFATVAATGLGGLLVLTNIGVYSRNMVGAPSELASNNSPPSICLIALTLWLVAGAMTLRPALTRWLAKTRPWTAVVAANSVIMTVFLWHLTALVLGVLIAYPLGFPQPAGGTSMWWLTRPLWIAILVTLLVPFVVAFGRFERAGLTKRSPTVHSFDTGRMRSIGGIVLLVLGLSGFATAGFAHLTQPATEGVAFIKLSPLYSALALGAGHLMLRPRSAAR